MDIMTKNGYVYQNFIFNNTDNIVNDPIVCLLAVITEDVTERVLAWESTLVKAHEIGEKETDGGIIYWMET